ncbi:MAG TPA: ABC transporter permease [Thermodesulfobacteriota bacterium]|nr:ABC transporter permease [Thermodesulfobacteriota bacterium]
MVKFVVKRLLLAIPTIFAVLTIVFLIARVIPGDPATVILGDSASKEALDNLRQKLGLNQPLAKQYFDFVLNAIQGNLGMSLVSGTSVMKEVMNVLPYTIDLTIAGIIIGVVFGVPLGVLTAVYRNSTIDFVTRIASLFGLSFPAFYSAILLIIIFGLQLGWFPVLSGGDLTNPIQRLHHLILPGVNLGLIMVAYVTRATRSSMLEVLREDYIRTAKAKGLPGIVVLFRHAIRNAMIPIITVIGLYLGVLVGNSVLTEIVFNRPGLGKLIIGALNQRDYSMLQGLMVVYGFIIVLTNLITDLTYGFSDPRVKYS